jgi:DNA-binding ferritin-like protein
MEKVLVLLRTLQLYGQNAHNLAKGKSFFADHDAMADFYSAAAADYDMVVERMIGCDMEVDLVKVHKNVCGYLEKLPHNVENEKALEYIMALEKKLCAEVEKECKKSVSEGTRQLIGEVANKSESRQYKMKQRLK